MKVKIIGLMVATGGLVLSGFMPALANSAQSQAFEGTVEVYISEGSAITHHIEDGVVKYQYVLNTKNGQQLNLDFHGQTPHLQTGSVIRVHGRQVDNTTVDALGTDSINLQVLSTTSVTTTAQNYRKTAVILFNFIDNSNLTTTPAQAGSVTYTGTDSANAYYQEVSNGIWGISGYLNPDGDVFGPYTINYPQITCSNYNWATAAKQAAAVDGFSSNYNNIVYNFPQTSACGWYGLGSIGGGSTINPSQAWINGTYATQVLAHEMGHNFGLYHAHTESCVDANNVRVTISTNCTAAEYGDPFDIMGNTRAAHMNNYEKYNYASPFKFSWIPSSNLVDVTSDGDYTLAPQEGVSTQPQILRIPRSYDSYGNLLDEYYLEFRQPYGQYDNFFTASSPLANGVSIRIGSSLNGSSSDDGSYLLDATPLTTTFDDSALALNKSFYDAAAQVTVTTTSVSNAAATVHVHFGPPVCDTYAPSVSISPVSQSAYPSQSVNYTVTIADNNSSLCPSATYTVTPTLLSGLTQSPASQDVTLTSGASASFTAGILVAANQAAGSYFVTETAVDNSNSSLQSSATATLVVNPADTTPPQVSITQPGNGSTIKGNVTISATASDPSSGVAKIQLFVDNSLIKICSNTTSCSVSYNTGGLSKGNHTIKATATDKDLPTANSISTSITVRK